MTQYELYGRGESGNTYKAALLSLCGLDWQPRLVDFFNPETKSNFAHVRDEMGEIPVLEFDGGRLGGQAPFYRCYECADGRFISVGPIERPFYIELLDRIGAPSDLAEHQNDPAKWAARGDILASLFKAKTRNEWCSILEGTDACFAPVSNQESIAHPHLRSRATYINVNGLEQAAPAPRFSRTPGVVGGEGDGWELRERWLGQPLGE